MSGQARTVDAVACCRLVAENSALPMVMTLGSGHAIRYANDAFVSLSGRQAEELLGLPFVQVLPEPARKGCEILLDRVLSLGEPTLLAAPAASLTRGDSTWSFTASRLGLDQPGLVIQATDLTEATLGRLHCEKVNEEIRSVNQLLLLASLRRDELAVQAATAEQQLLQSRKMEGIGRLAGGIAHDFNNLLTAILGYAHLAEDATPADSEAQPSLRGIRAAAKRAAVLTSQLLAFARKQIIHPRVVDLNSLISDLDNMLRRLLGASIELSFLPTAKPAFVRIDPGQFGQVLMNLVVNARDAMPAGGRILVSTEIVTLDERAASALGDFPPGEHVVLSVCDAGVGMTDEVQAHLFEPFFTTKAQGQGTGLGLATCYGIVRQNGGHIRVASVPGEGTTIAIYLPCVAVVAEPARTVVATPVPRGTELIALVDDEPMIRDLAAQILKRQGYSVLEAGNGREALGLLEGRIHEIDLLVTDMTMPHMGGKELADCLRAQRPQLRVLYMSGHTDADIVRDGVLEAGVAFLHKPFAPAGLARKVRETLDRGLAGPEASPAE